MVSGWLVSGQEIVRVVRNGDGPQRVVSEWLMVVSEWLMVVSGWLVSGQEICAIGWQL